MATLRTPKFGDVNLEWYLYYNSFPGNVIGVGSAEMPTYPVGLGYAYTLLTDKGNMVFIPEDYILGGKQVGNTQVFSKNFLDKNFLENVYKVGQPVDIAGYLPFLDSTLAQQGYRTKGVLIPEKNFSEINKELRINYYDINDPAEGGRIGGRILGMADRGDKLVYMRERVGKNVNDSYIDDQAVRYAHYKKYKYGDIGEFIGGALEAFAGIPFAPEILLIATKSPVVYATAKGLQVAGSGGDVKDTLRAYGTAWLTASVSQNPYVQNIGATIAPTLTPSVQAIIGSSVSNAAISGVIASLRGQDVGKSILAGATAGALSASATDFAAQLVGGADNLINLGKTFNFTPEEAATIITGAFSDGIIGTLNDKDFLQEFGNSLVSRGVGQTAAVEINRELIDSVGADRLSDITNAAKRIATVATNAALNNQNVEDAIKASVPGILIEINTANKLREEEKKEAARVAKEEQDLLTQIQQVAQREFPTDIDEIQLAQLAELSIPIRGVYKTIYVGDNETINEAGVIFDKATGRYKGELTENQLRDLRIRLGLPAEAGLVGGQSTVLGGEAGTQIGTTPSDPTQPRSNETVTGTSDTADEIRKEITGTNALGAKYNYSIVIDKQTGEVGYETKATDTTLETTDPLRTSITFSKTRPSFDFRGGTEAGLGFANLPETVLPIDRASLIPSTITTPTPAMTQFQGVIDNTRVELSSASLQLQNIIIDREIVIDQLDAVTKANNNLIKDLNDMIAIRDASPSPKVKTEAEKIIGNLNNAINSNKNTIDTFNKNITTLDSDLNKFTNYVSNLENTLNVATKNLAEEVRVAEEARVVQDIRTTSGGAISAGSAFDPTMFTTTGTPRQPSDSLYVPEAVPTPVKPAPTKAEVDQIRSSLSAKQQDLNKTPRYRTGFEFRNGRRVQVQVENGDWTILNDQVNVLQAQLDEALAAQQAAAAPTAPTPTQPPKQTQELPAPVEKPTRTDLLPPPKPVETGQIAPDLGVGAGGAGVDTGATTPQEIPIVAPQQPGAGAGAGTEQNILDAIAAGGGMGMPGGVGQGEAALGGATGEEIGGIGGGEAPTGGVTGGAGAGDRGGGIGAGAIPGSQPPAGEITDREILDAIAADREAAPEGQEPPPEEELPPTEEPPPEGEEVAMDENEVVRQLLTRLSPVVISGRQQRGQGEQQPGISPRVTGEALASILGEKEPLFGGDEDEQRAVWNRRSLRLRRALGL